MGLRGTMLTKVLMPKPVVSDCETFSAACEENWARRPARLGTAV
jgi:hypothetical protein